MYQKKKKGTVPSKEHKKKLKISHKIFLAMEKLEAENPKTMMFINYSPVVLFSYAFFTIDNDKFYFDFCMFVASAIGTANGFSTQARKLGKYCKAIIFIFCIFLGTLFGAYRWAYNGQCSIVLDGIASVFTNQQIGQCAMDKEEIKLLRDNEKKRLEGAAVK